MSDRYYTQMMKHLNLSNRTELEAYLAAPIKDTRSKRDIAVSLGNVGLEKLVKEQLLWVENNYGMLKRKLEGYVFGKKADVVKYLLDEYPEITWNNVTLDTLKEIK